MYVTGAGIVTSRVRWVMTSQLQFAFCRVLMARARRRMRVAVAVTGKLNQTNCMLQKLFDLLKQIHLKTAAILTFIGTLTYLDNSCESPPDARTRNNTRPSAQSTDKQAQSASIQYLYYSMTLQCTYMFVKLSPLYSLIRN